MNRFVFIAAFCICTLLVACSAKQPAALVLHQGAQVDTGDAASCLKCHADMQKHSHPVMVPYPPAGKEKEYASIAEVRKAGIRIIDDQVSCISCHDLTNPEPNHPIPGMDKSRLCLVCHRK